LIRKDSGKFTRTERRIWDSETPWNTPEHRNAAVKDLIAAQGLIALSKGNKKGGMRKSRTRRNHRR